MDLKQVIEKLQYDGDLSVGEDVSVSEERRDLSFYQEACEWLIEENKKTERSIKDGYILIAAAVKTNGGKLVINDCDIMTAGDLKLYRYNDGKNKRIVFTLK